MTDNEKYMISIIGEQKLDDDTDKIEVITAGNYILKTVTATSVIKNTMKMPPEAILITLLRLTETPLPSPERDR